VSSPTPVRKSLWRETADDPTVRAIALYALIAAGAVFAAYMAIFTTFVDYDDEGTLLVSLNAFAHGDALYKDVFSPYGPFFYEFFGGIFSLPGVDVTNDTSRLLVIAIWVATSFLIGLACQRLTGRLLLGGAGMIVAFAALYALFPEPMHPHGLLVLLLAGFALAAVYGPGRRVALCGAVAGALLAAALMTKINFGAYAIAAVVLAAGLTFEPLSRRPWVRWPLIVAFLAMSVVVMFSDLREGWVRSFITMEVLGSAAIVAAAWPMLPARGESQGALGRWLLGALAGCLGALAAILAAIVALGTSPSDLYDGMFVQALNVRNVAKGAFPTPDQAVYWGVAAFAAAVLTAKLRTTDPGKPALWPGLLRALAGLTIWLTISHAAPFGLNPSTNPDILPLLLSWVAVVPPAGPLEPPYKRFLRVALAAIAVGGVLGAYPVPGAQVGVASMMFAPVGALCLADALASLRAWSAARGELDLRRFGAVVGVASAALVGMLALGQIVLPAASDTITYDEWPALPFAGAGDIHLAPEQVDEYAQAVDFIERNCSNFIGYPNVNSLYLWSGITPPRPSAPGAWVAALDDKGQARILRQLHATPRPCVLRNEKVAGMWLSGKEPPDTPLAHYINEDFETAGQVGQFELQLPKRGS
jgi:hypothetical protein